MYFDLQKASMLKRCSAWLLDAIVFSVIAAGFGWLVSTVIGYDEQYNRLDACYAAYEKEYGLRLTVSEEEYAGLSEEVQASYQRMFEQMNQDAELSRQYAYVINLTLLILSVSFLLAFLVTGILIPLVLRDGQTIGKKIFGLCLMQTDHTKLRTVSLVIRVILGKYAIETMVPAYLILMIFFQMIGRLGTITMMLLIILQVSLLFFTKANQALHDLLAGTVVVDAKSQMIFESREAMAEFKKQNEK